MATFKSLLTEIKSVVKTAVGDGNYSNLYKVKTVKRGMLSPIEQYPVIINVPVSESFDRFYSGGQYQAVREVEFFIYTKRKYRTIEADRIENLKIVEELRNLVYTELLHLTSVYDIVLGSEVYYDATSFGNVMIQEGKFKATFWSKENLPIDRVERVSLNTSAVYDLYDCIRDVLKEAVNVNDIDVMKMEDTNIRPIGKFPAIGVIELDTALTHGETGRDTQERAFRVYVWSKCFDKEIALDSNLDLLESVKNIIWKNYKWNGLCKNTRIQGINFSLTDRENVLIYSTRVDFVCSAVSTVPVI